MSETSTTPEAGYVPLLQRFILSASTSQPETDSTDVSECQPDLLVWKSSFSTARLTTDLSISTFFCKLSPEKLTRWIDVLEKIQLEKDDPLKSTNLITFQKNKDFRHFFNFPKTLTFWHLFEEHAGHHRPMLFFAALLSLYPYVEKIVCWDYKDHLSILTIVNNSTEEQRFAIYDRQWDLMQIFKDIPIDFDLLDREDTPLEDLITLGEHAWILQP